MTQHAETNIFTIFGGVRKQYHDAFRLWHDQAKDNSELFLEQQPGDRKFQAPPNILAECRSKVLTGCDPTELQILWSK